MTFQVLELLEMCKLSGVYAVFYVLHELMSTCEDDLDCIIWCL